jgi:hypothetical protein
VHQESCDLLRHDRGHGNAVEIGTVFVWLRCLAKGLVATYGPVAFRKSTRNPKLKDVTKQDTLKDQRIRLCNSDLPQETLAYLVCVPNVL